MRPITLSVRVTAPTPAVARVSVGRRHFAVGRPVEFDDASPHVAALEYAIGAVGGEVVNGLREFGRRRRVEIDDIEAVVLAELADAMAYLDVIGEPGVPRLNRIAVKVFVSGPNTADIRALFDHVVARLPLVGTLRLALDLTLDLIITS